MNWIFLIISDKKFLKKKNKMATIGKIEPFDESEETCDIYIERVDQYFKCNEIGDAKKASAILTLMGAKTKPLFYRNNTILFY